jgi:protocatechuate 3,4-dioxygenase beta subunit
LAPAVVAAAQEKPGDTGFSLRGKVVDGVSGHPIRNVELRLSDLHWQQAAEPAVADPQGRFVFSGLTAGEYILSGDSPETGPVFFDELPEPGLAQTIQIKPEEPERVVVFRIMPRIAIGGTVRDEFGDPVERAMVTFHRPAWVDRRVILHQVQQTTTDDRGRYRAGRLPPGGYVVCAGAARNGAGEAIAATAGPVDFASRRAPHIYTQTCDPDLGGSQPAVMKVPAGQQAEVDLTLVPVPAVSVLGRLRNLPPAGGLGVRLVRDSEFSSDPPLFTTAGEDGTFAFRGVLPGNWRLEADASWQEPDGTRKSLLARLPIEVGSANVDGMDVPLDPAGVIDVVLHSLEGEKISPERVQLGLRPTVARSGNMQWAQPDPPAPFRFSALAAGSYRLVTRTNATTCIESATMGEQDVLHGTVTATSGMTARLDVTVSRDCGEIKGRVVREGKPVPDAKVLLLLSGSATEPDDLLADYANEQGEIQFVGLAPGRYRLWAWHVDSFGSFVGPASLDGAEEQSAVVQVDRGKHVTIDVPLLRQEGGLR